MSIIRVSTAITDDVLAQQSVLDIDGPGLDMTEVVKFQFPNMRRNVSNSLSLVMLNWENLVFP